MRPSIFLGAGESNSAFVKYTNTKIIKTSTGRFAKAPAVLNSPCSLAQMNQASRSQILFYIQAGRIAPIKLNNCHPVEQGVKPQLVANLKKLNSF